MQMTEIEKMVVWLLSSASYIISTQGPVTIFYVILEGFSSLILLGSTVLVLNEPLLIKCSSWHCPHLLNYRGLFLKNIRMEKVNGSCLTLRNPYTVYLHHSSCHSLT